MSAIRPQQIHSGMAVVLTSFAWSTILPEILAIVSDGEASDAHISIDCT
jgi:hypothetical protein